MAKRFTDTAKWKDTWFQDLPAKYKLFWIYLLDECDAAGLWKPNIKLANFQIGENFQESELINVFSERITVTDSGYWFVNKFIKFQYGELSENCKPHLPIIKTLKSHKIKGYPKGIHTLEEKEQEKEKEKEKESAVVVDLEPETTYPIEKCLEIALKDERWVKANATNKAELQQFNAALTGTGEYEKNPLYYKKHFHHWKKKGKLQEVVPKMQTGGGLAKIEAMLRGDGSG